MIKKLDLKKELEHLYVPSAKKVEIVRVPTFGFVTTDGQMEPGETPETSPAFQNALRALYGISYTLKFMSKLRERNPIDYTVMALEGLWWVDSGEFDFNVAEPWKWTLMIMQPKHITDKMYQEALQQFEKKKASPALSQVRFEAFSEGRCIQTLHIGPYSEEPQTINRMKAFAQEKGYVYCGGHHEIYLGDPRRAKPEKLRTVLRHPVERRA